MYNPLQPIADVAPFKNTLVFQWLILRLQVRLLGEEVAKLFNRFFGEAFW